MLLSIPTIFFFWVVSMFQDSLAEVNIRLLLLFLVANALNVIVKAAGVIFETHRQKFPCSCRITPVGGDDEPLT